jgi:hypothetical protein
MSMTPAQYAKDVPQERTRLGFMRSQRIFTRSQRVCYEAWHQVAQSRQRILRRRAIAGGSDNALRTEIRARLIARTLPAVDGRAWAGIGSAVNRCVCCREVIGRSDRELEPQAHAGLHAHTDCFTVWLAESVAMRWHEQRSGTESPSAA